MFLLIRKTTDLSAFDMPGLQNKRSSGQYFGLHPVRVGNSVVTASSTAVQPAQVGGGLALFEQSKIDTQLTVHPKTLSVPVAPGANIAAVCAKAAACIGSSDLFFINNIPTNQSNTKKYQNDGNCVVSNMFEPSVADSIFYVNG